MSGAETIAKTLPLGQAGYSITPRATERSKPESATSARASAIVRLRPQWVWHRLSDPCNWSQLLEHLSSVTKSDLDIDEYAWSVLGLTCKIRLTVREPPLHLAWQSDAGAQMRLSGEIILEPLDWYTRLTVQLNYVTADPHLSLLLRTLQVQLQRDLAHMVQALETRTTQVVERPICEPS